MDKITIQLNVLAPRWGHDDIYTFELSRDSLVIDRGAQSITCTWRDNLDPKWSGEESLRRILENDAIYPPAAFEGMIEHVWTSWRNGEIDATAVERELQEAVVWLNKITSAKPKTDFWRKYF